MTDQSDEDKQMSDEEREHIINNAAERFARLFLEQVLDKRRMQRKNKSDDTKSNKEAS